MWSYPPRNSSSATSASRGDLPRSRSTSPNLLDRGGNRRIEPRLVFDLELPLEQAADGYRAMDEGRAIKTLLRP